MQFLYVGRLDKEKWIESLIFCIEQLIKTNTDFHIDIYGEWWYTSHVKKLSYKYPKHITHHGRKHKQEIIWQRTKADFFIMPSTFLETFGLTACESLLCWVPVIGNKKWWLIPFIDDALDIQQTLWKNDWEKLYNLISNLIKNNISKKQYHNLIESTKETYTKTKWIRAKYSHGQWFCKL
jgi:glycosyltransferase involved in cell wall biosynthesis